LENQWGRGVLLNFLSTDLYESQGAALTNFATTLPKPESDLAQEYFKDPHHFEFLQRVRLYSFSHSSQGVSAKYSSACALRMGISFTAVLYNS
jgi:predicted nuclease of restriction endonuclease-like (RecB) superfamily